MALALRGVSTVCKAWKAQPAPRDQRCQDQRRHCGQSDQCRRPEPATDPEAFVRHQFDRPADHGAGGERDDGNRQPRCRLPIRPPSPPCGSEDQSREDDASGGLPAPVRMIGDRPAPFKFGLAGSVVEQSPIAADGAFEPALPGLVEGFDHVDAVAACCGRAPGPPAAPAPG